MVVQLAQPCRVRYRRRAAVRTAVRVAPGAAAAATAGGTRVVVDLDLCQGHGVCATEAPAVFRLDHAGGKVELLDPQPPDTLRAQVDLAVRHCPTRAIKLVED